jgi:hypothetical protein
LALHAHHAFALFGEAAVMRIVNGATQKSVSFCWFFSVRFVQTTTPKLLPRNQRTVQHVDDVRGDTIADAWNVLPSWHPPKLPPSFYIILSFLSGALPFMITTYA